MASMRDMKRRRASIQSTEQITKTVKLVATVKLQKSRVKAEDSKPYFNLMCETISSTLQKSGTIHHKYLQPSNTNKKAVVAVMSNRELAGGYNSNIVKPVSSELPTADTYVYVIGKKDRDDLIRKGSEIRASYHDVVNEPMYRDAADITLELLDSFAQGQIGEIYLAHTSLKNTMVHEPKLIKLLPVEINLNKVDPNVKAGALMDYEPANEEILDAIVPRYMSSLIYGALLEAVASENGARITAMDSVTGNAKEMIDALSLQYNRTRQGAITQELTEIIADTNTIG